MGTQQGEHFMEMQKYKFKSIQQMTELKCHLPQHLRGKPSSDPYLTPQIQFGRLFLH